MVIFSSTVADCCGCIIKNLEMLRPDHICPVTFSATLQAEVGSQGDDIYFLFLQ